MIAKDFEIMAPVGSRESLAAAIQAGAGSVYFGVEQLNMRSHSANHFTIDDLREIAALCREAGIKSYLTVNTIIYGEDLPLMRDIIDAAHEAGISAVIASDVAVMQYCRRVAVLDGTFTEARKDEWDTRLATVFNRGFWDGYYQGQLMGEWNKNYGSNATERKVYVGKGTKYYSKLGVAEFTVDADTFRLGDKLLVTGPTTGVMYLTATEIHDNDGHPVEEAPQGTRVAIPVTGKVRPSDKLFKLVSEES